jgi:hypothetical protein
MKISHRKVIITEKDGKKIYNYLQCKCGADKNPTSAYCKACQREVNKSQIKAAKLKKEYIEVEKMSKSMCTLIQYDNRGAVKVAKSKLIEFVDRIEKRNGWASMEEIFVEMITLFNFFGKECYLDTLSTGKQISSMWSFLKEKRNEYEKRKI